MDKIKRLHSLTIDDDNILINGIESIENSNSKLIIVRLANRSLVINGDNFNITNLDLETGTLKASGKTNDLKYTTSHEKQAFLKRIFK